MKGQRVKTGCLSCRRRRKKCDEQKPVCTGCARNKISCSWPPDPSENTNFRSSTALSGAGVALQPKPLTPKGDNVAVAVTKLPRQMPTSAGSLALADETSRRSYEHYYACTARRLGGNPDNRNPFLTYVLPLARQSPLVMQTVIAVGGAHLAVRETSAKYINFSSLCYQKAIRYLNNQLRYLTSGGQVDTLHIITAVLMLSQIEILSGQAGAAFQHLKAGRLFITSELSASHRQSEEILLNFLTELYAYMVLVQNIAPTREASARMLPFDPFVSNLGSLRQFPTSGVMLGCAHGLFEMIPVICIFGAKRQMELEAHAESAETLREYRDLQSEIRHWRPISSSGDPDWIEQQQRGAKMYRCCVLILLCAAWYQTTEPLPEYVADVQPLVDETLSLGLPFTTEYRESPMVTILLWPLIMMGSCIVDPIQQGICDAALAEIHSEVGTSLEVQMRKTLTTFWADPETFGPIALDKLMREGGREICIS